MQEDTPLSLSKGQLPSTLTQCQSVETDNSNFKVYKCKKKKEGIPNHSVRDDPVSEWRDRQQGIRVL